MAKSQTIAATLSFAVLSMAGCASSTTDRSATTNNSAQTATTTLTTEKMIDASADTQWFSVERNWPDKPYMGLVNTKMADKETFAVTLVCDIDTGKVTGVLDFQPGAMVGREAVLGLSTSEGVEKDLSGVYKQGEGDVAEFHFPIDWLTIKDIADADRTDILAPNGESVLGIVTPDFERRGSTRLLVSKEGFDEHQGSLYYYCNPK